MFGPAGVAIAATDKKLLIDMSSIDPADTAEMAARLQAETGMAWVDCPLSGGAPGALEGRLTIMAGGTVEDFERARPVMRHLAANYTLMGPSGAGQTVKLINQLFCGVLFQAVAEAVKLAEAGGVEPVSPGPTQGGAGDAEKGTRRVETHGQRASRRRALSSTVSPRLVMVSNAERPGEPGRRGRLAVALGSVELELAEVAMLAMDAADRAGDRAVDDRFRLDHVLAELHALQIGDRRGTLSG